MITFVLQIIVVLSLSGLVFMVIRKMPVLASLPLEEIQSTKRRKGMLVKKFKTLKRHLDEKSVDGLKTIKEQSERLKKTDSTKQKQFDKQPDYWDQITKD